MFGLMPKLRAFWTCVLYIWDILISLVIGSHTLWTGHVTYKRQCILVYVWVRWLWVYVSCHISYWYIATKLGATITFWTRPTLKMFRFIFRASYGDKCFVILLIISILHLCPIGLSYVITIIDHVSYILPVFCLLASS